MNQKLLIVVNFLLAALIALQFVTVASGVRGVIGELHEANGYLIGFLILVHLYLNRTWIRAVVLKYKRPSKTR